jgi:hypothetical protein
MAAGVVIVHLADDNGRSTAVCGELLEPPAQNLPRWTRFRLCEPCRLKALFHR